MLLKIRDYLTLGTLSTVASVVGIVSGGEALFGNHGGGGGGGGGGGAGATAYVPQWQGGADQMWQQIMQQLGGDIGGERAALLPFLMNAFSSASAGVPALQARLGGYGDVMERTGNNFLGAQMDLEHAGSDLWQLARDPQNALHDRTQQQVVDAARGADSARGIGMGSYSAGNEGNTVSNFNIDWQNNLLSRAATGMQGLTGAYDAAGRQGQAGDAALAGAGSMFQSAMALPFDLSSLFTGSMNSMYSPYGALTGNLQQYLGLGQSAGQNAFNQQQTGLNNLTTGLNQLSQQPWMQNFFSAPPPSTYYTGGNNATGNYETGEPGGNWPGPG